MGIISAVILLGVLIFIHELGHFLLAKKRGVLVERFSIGFGPVIFKKTKGETEYALSAIPLGGYVKMYGEQPDADVDPNLAHRSFAAKSIFSRFLIVFAGPFFNFVLAVIIYSVIFMAGTPRFTADVGDVAPDSAAFDAGLKKGDVITAIDGQQMNFWDDMTSYVQERGGQALRFTILRDGKSIELTMTPRTITDKNIFGEEIKIGRVGIVRGEKTVLERQNPVSAIYSGFEQTYRISEMMVVGIVKLFQKTVPADSLGGPIMIVKMAKDSADNGFLSFFSFMAVISINLGILNLLPIPVLDGGHILFLIIEAVTRRPVSLRVREVSNMFGMAFLMFVMFFAFYNDITRFFK